MDIILYNILIAFACLLFGYLCGSIPFGIIISKLLFNSDVRKFGSNNSGGTNVARVYGKKWGIITILLDMLKVILPVWGVWAIFTFTPLNQAFYDSFGTYLWNITLYIFLTPLGAAIGHCWPLYAGFKGGKTVAVFAGFGIGTNWFLVITGVIAFFITLKKSKYVSLSSIILAVVSALFAWILFVLKITVFSGFDVVIQNVTMMGFGFAPYFYIGWEYATVITLIAGLLILRHKANIVRLINGTENKIHSKKVEQPVEPQKVEN